jgi:Spy/CpxP family protein refolding chaperone
MEDMFMQRIQSRALTAGAALLLVIGLAAAAHAQGDGPRRYQRAPFGLGGPGRGFAHLGRLGLTDAQREQVRDVVQRHRSEMQEAGKRLHEAHEAQRTAVEAIPVNEGLIRSTTQTLANAQTDMALLRARIHNEVWGLLTPEQQEKAKQLKSERDTRLKQRAERRRQRQG